MSTSTSSSHNLSVSSSSSSDSSDSSSLISGTDQSKDQSWDQTMVESVRRRLFTTEEYDAVERLELAIEHDPDNIDTLFELGMTLLNISKRLIAGSGNELVWFQFISL